MALTLFVLVVVSLAFGSPASVPHAYRHSHRNSRLTQCHRSTSGLPCPKGLKCGNTTRPQFPQRTVYAGHPLACLGQLPPPTLDGELNTLVNLFAAASQSLFALETPIQIRAVYYFDQATWNALTYSDARSQPHAYASGFGLPFSPRDTGASLRDKNIAIAYSFWRICLGVAYDGCPALQGLLAGPLDLDPTYMPNDNFDFTDPRDVGTAAALATLEYAKTDEWNSQGRPGFPMPFQDYNDFQSAYNSPTVLSDITKWQPLLETKGDGYYTHQTHVGAVLGGRKVTPFSRSADFYTRFKVSGNLYPDQDKLTEADLAAYKAQAEDVINVAATLTERQKMLANAFDTKLLSFGFVPIGQYAQQNQWSLMKTAEYALAAGAAVYDGTLASFAEKMRINAVRPNTAIRYLFENQNITTYAGPNAGTQTFPGREFNSYLRSMPHSDSPSASACICIAFAEVTERMLESVGSMTYGINFPQGCSFVEPGTVPSADLQVLFTNTADFIRDCTQSRVWAGVHFQRSVDSARNMCPGIGELVYQRIVQLRGY